MEKKLNLQKFQLKLKILTKIKYYKITKIKKVDQNSSNVLTLLWNSYKLEIE